MPEQQAELLQWYRVSEAVISFQSTALFPGNFQEETLRVPLPFCMGSQSGGSE